MSSAFQTRAEHLRSHHSPDPVLQLRLPGLVQPEASAAQTLDERFAAFHAANPHVLDALEQLALDLVRRGRRRIGVGMLFEVLRWSSLRTDGDEYRLNNSYRSRYARLLAASNADLAEAFEMRELRT